EEYQKALKWAISANSIDSKNEKSWALFAKASAKLGRKQNAENALENFARTSGSENIKTLLRQIKAGEI
ncbi:MAG TPA: anaphase-promoting protein, partial [Campylobacterales bacterium]|nr:anaphase-promoting protein [Campylobacterales bacterium]